MVYVVYMFECKLYILFWKSIVILFYYRVLYLVFLSRWFCLFRKIYVVLLMFLDIFGIKFNLGNILENFEVNFCFYNIDINEKLKLGIVGC